MQGLQNNVVRTLQVSNVKEICLQDITASGTELICDITLGTFLKCPYCIMERIKLVGKKYCKYGERKFRDTSKCFVF